MSNSKLYNDFWDSFDTEKYEDFIELKNERLEIRINDETKEKFQDKVNEKVGKGGVTKVLTAFIHFINNL